MELGTRRNALSRFPGWDLAGLTFAFTFLILKTIDTLHEGKRLNEWPLSG